MAVILPAGSFRTSEYRKPIPVRVQMIALLNTILRQAVCHDHAADIDLNNLIGCIEDFKMALQGKAVDIDHRPPLQDRDYDLDANDFVPGQHDPNYLEALIDKQHDERTFGRVADAEKTVTTKGSDSWNRKHNRKLKTKQELHDVKMAVKRGDPEAIAKLLKVERRQRPKSRIPSRPFPKRQRQDRSRSRSRG